MSQQMNSDAQRAQFLNDTVLSASPARLLTMLYDRLVLDLDRGMKAQVAGDVAEANSRLTHAQDIVAELIVTLDVDAWEGGPGLKGLYSHLLNELVQANISNDPVRTAACRSIVDPLRMAWHEAAGGLAQEAAQNVPVGAGSISAGSGFLGVG
ncbi:flagellar export chaperone FliS [Sanguibacter antarcticus]|uniref:Flagellar protein FliS n=1 Tax=Sanguibacter antarcticus TaxID=372484 RepID=A0A2A9E0R2_9MICO|nr:flagellar export chaperone FliS [Sanguibacter antarcticus]PFG32226.1 flagellar protein FliS [Sanguibacter antarcticus]